MSSDYLDYRRRLVGRPYPGDVEGAVPDRQSAARRVIRGDGYNTVS